MYCAKIKKDSLNQNTPIIAVTAHILLGEKEQFLQKGMDDCLAKPIDEIALQSIIDKWAPNTQSEDLIPPPLLQNKDIKEMKFINNQSFDWSLALKQSAGKTELAKEMLLMLLDEFDDIRNIANDAIQGNIERELFYQSIHKFHGGCSYSGVHKLKDIARLIEHELKLGETPSSLEPELLELLDELDNVEEEAQPYLT